MLTSLDGDFVGLEDRGDIVGILVVGLPVTGFFEGCLLGFLDGCRVGLEVGLLDGCRVGLRVSLIEGE